MQRVRIGIIGAGTTVEWGVLPVLTGPDAVAPLDTGAWWTRRPTPGGDIRFQPPAVPEVVAICDPASGGSMARVESLARQARIPSTYTDWRQMVRETQLDAVLVAGDEPSGALQGRPEAEEVAKVFAASPRTNGSVPDRWLWLDGAPARDQEQTEALSRSLRARNIRLWLSKPLRHAAAHRSAKRLLERDGIGTVSGLQLRWPWPLDAAHDSGTHAALDLLLSFVSGGSGVPLRAFATKNKEGAFSVWFTLNGGASATILASSADTWNSPLPRLEVTGTQGRYMLCEGGRRMQLFVPREATRTWEPPGMAAHVSSANVLGLSEDVKGFLAATANEAAEEIPEADWEFEVRVLALMEAIRRSLESGSVEEVQLRSVTASPGRGPVSRTASPVENLTLNLA
jgi:predicted dehydrogenase